MLSFNRKEWILFFRKGESGDLRTTSCYPQIVNLDKYAGLQTIIIYFIFPTIMLEIFLTREKRMCYPYIKIIGKSEVHILIVEKIMEGFV